MFERFVPLFEQVLVDAVHPRGDRVDVDSNWYSNQPEPEYDKNDEEFDDKYEKYMENRVPELPVVPEFYKPPRISAAKLKELSLKGRRLQVIVKLANIILTPEKPEYKGGSWHVEGMQNERIVASGIYYYESDNITESRLQFRQAMDEPDYEQNDNRGVEAVFGLEDGAALNQLLGSVITQSDRCIAFPNLYQHQVAPFKLADPSRSGVRRILVFFLVDPFNPIVSTAQVAPQQMSWYLSLIHI